MRKPAIALACIGIILLLAWLLMPSGHPGGVRMETVYLADGGNDDEENEEYDGPAERDSLEFMKTVDPTLGYVPYERMQSVMERAIQEDVLGDPPVSSGILWEERGPIRDIVGPSNGNLRGASRANLYYTAGRIRAVLPDTLNDPSGNTVFAAGVAGGLWKCSNFWSGDVPNWTVVNDYFVNMAISSICQDPTNPQVMYFSTGEPTSNADAVIGGGFWKTTDGGNTWFRLPASEPFVRTFKLVCDASGNVYAALRPTVFPREQPFGLVRSKDGGVSWENITPSNLTSANNVCTDLEFSAGGRLHAAFGYLGGTGTVVNHLYTDIAANAGPGSWSQSTGIRIASSITARRMELASAGNVLYAVTTNGFDVVDSIYRSANNGETWTRQNASLVFGNIGQAWYNLTLAINPANTSEIAFGAIDAYRSLNAGATFTRLTAWVLDEPYVHADHHYMAWYTKGAENRLIVGGDGGMFLSQNGGGTWRNRNENLAIKQFYDASIHPDAGSPYLIAGAQDNGSHQISTPGKSQSVEVTGGDGAFVHINKLNPNIQFASFVFNQYRRSTNGGATWTPLNFNSALGLFINPFDYDDAQNIMYASNANTFAPNNQLRRWPNANTGIANQIITIPLLARGTTNSNVTSVKVSPHTPNRVFVGSNTGRLIVLDNANATVTSSFVTTSIGSDDFPTAFLNCINVGSTDNYLVAVFTNFGVNNVWYSRDGGATWDAIDGDLPDMPVRWAVFHPQFDNRLILATEAGVYTTDAVNGNNTRWARSPGFPLVRTDALELRASDNTIVAATHGRGLYTGRLQTSTMPEVNFMTSITTVEEMPGIPDAGNTCRTYRDYELELGILNAPADAVQVRINVAAGTTALPGVDFQYTTNGNFTSISNTVDFPAGERPLRAMQVRVYDDAEVESLENINFQIEVLSGTNALAGAVANHVFMISDFDRPPVIVPTITNLAVGVFNSQIVNASPFAANRTKHRSQSLLSATELYAAGLRAGMPVHNMSIEVIKKHSTQPFYGFTISLAHTTVSSLSAGFVPLGHTFATVYSGDYTTTVGINTFNFSTPFVWDGTSNIAVQCCFDNEGKAGPALYPDFVAGNTYPLGAGVRSSAFSNFITGAAAGCNLPAALVVDGRFNALLGADCGLNPIATETSSQATHYLNAGNSLYYFDNNANIIAGVTNLSGNDMRCTRVAIERQGTGATRFWNANKQNFLTDKAYHVSTGGPGKYRITLYFTRGEKEGWEAATGNAWSQVQLVRTTGSIANVTPANAKPNNNGTVAEVVNPVHGAYGDGFTLTGVFTGSGGIAAGAPGRQFNVVAAAQASQALASDMPVATSQFVQVINNPFGSELRLRFAQPLASNATAALMDVQGKVLVSATLAKGSTTAGINTASRNIQSSNVYMLRITQGGRSYVVKVLKQ